MNIKGVLSGIMVLGIILLVLPFVAASNIGTNGIGFTTFLWSIPGLILTILSLIGLVISNLYVKAKGNLAYVKTGMGGLTVIKDHGAIVIGFLHEIIPVSLETMKIVVERNGRDSLITLDKLRAEVVAEFYIRVKPDGGPEGGIATAARTLGNKISAATEGKRADQMGGDQLLEAMEIAIKTLEREKLIDGLRTVAAKSTLEDLNLKRDEFKKALMEVVKDGLAENGLELEDCTISALDQASKEIMDPNNTFDAQGLKNLQQTISEQSVARNEFEKDAELAIREKDVTTAQAILEQDQALEFKTADQDKEVRSYKADQDKEARTAEIQSEEAIATRRIAKENAVQVADVASEREVATKGVEKEQAIATATVEKKRTVEVAERDKDIAIANKEAERAKAEEERQQAESGAEKALQDVKTVTVEETANREKSKAVIDKEAEVQKVRIEEQMKADVVAYATEKEAEGRKLAAEADYDAKTKAAEADQIEQEAKAVGQRAIDMVPIEVSARKVEVDKDRVETVLKPELAAKSAHAKVSIDLTLGEARIAAEKEVGVAMAGAMGLSLSKANMTIYGDPETFTKMTASFQKGQGFSQVVEGMLDGSSTGGIGQVLSILEPLAEKFGIDLSKITPNTEDSNTTDAENSETSSVDQE